ncbi:MAG: ATP-binding protein, partial [Planctomycetota bacterium]
MKRAKPAIQISLALAIAALGVFFIAEMIGLVPDSRGAITDGRRQLAESAAVGCSIACAEDDTDAMTAILVAMVRRSDTVVSAGVRNTEGELITQAGPHEKLFAKAAEGDPLNTHAIVPIYLDSQPWGQLEITFQAIGSGNWLDRLRSNNFVLIGFLGVGSFIAFLLLLRRILEHLDPSKVIPGRVQAMLDCLAEGVLVLDHRGRIVMANTQMAEMYGCKANDLIGKRPAGQPWSLCDQSDGQGVLPWESSLESKTVHRGVRMTLQMPDRSERTFMVNSAPVYRPDGACRGTLATFDDVTGLEEKTVQLQQAMAEVSQSRDKIQTQNRQLDEARAAAEAANEAKSSFLANMSHEIRTPMTAIMGFAETLAEADDMPGDHRQAAQIINTNAHHLLTLINDVLDLSKIEAGRMTIEQTDCRPDQILLEVKDLLAIKAEAAGVDLQFHCHTHIPRQIRSDPTRLRQILVNLAGNAIKFAPDGHVQVRADYQCDNPGQACLLLSVVDDGIGMSSDQVEKLFTAFIQADLSTTRKFGGTGLGLAISRHLARLMGGDITVRSAPQAGSTFTLRLPIEPAEKDQLHKPDLSAA